MSDLLSAIIPNAVWDLIKYLSNLVLAERTTDQQLEEIMVKNEISLKINGSDQIVSYKVFADRLSIFLRLVNSSITSQISQSKLARMLGEESPERTIMYFEGKAIPDFVYLEKLCQQFGFNEDFFHGISASVFDTTCTGQIDSEDYFGRIEELKPQKLYFLMDQQGDTSIAARLPESRFKIVARGLVIRSTVGATGLSKMKAIRSLINEIEQRKISYSSYLLSNEDYSLIANGLVYLGILDHPKMVDTHWADDYSDPEYYEKNRKMLSDKYGEEFDRAMSVLINNSK